MSDDGVTCRVLLSARPPMSHSLETQEIKSGRLCTAKAPEMIAAGNLHAWAPIVNY